jgi:hypothetical protein
MKRWFCLLILGLITLSVTAPPALAADVWHQFSAQAAQNSQLGKDKLRPGIKLFMKGEKHAKILKQFGEFKSNKRSNGFGKSAQGACDTAFLSALIALQDRAVKEGGNAVIDIYTITKDKPFASAEQYSCIKGGFVTNVALMGTVVSLAE